MNADRSARRTGAIARKRVELLEEHVTRRVLRVFYDVYNELGGGFLESVYSSALEIAFADAGLAAAREVPLPVYYRGVVIGGFRADFVVMSRVVVEVKAGRCLDVAHDAQLDNYLRASGIQVGLLLHFGLKPAFRRRVCQRHYGVIRVHPRNPRLPLPSHGQEPPDA